MVTHGRIPAGELLSDSCQCCVRLCSLANIAPPQPVHVPHYWLIDIAQFTYRTVLFVLTTKQNYDSMYVIYYFKQKICTVNFIKGMSISHSFK